MASHLESKARAEAVYNSAADRYDDPANTFWSRFGERTIERLALRPGENVLDVCCGSGASAIPAAERVGPGGRVLAVDLAERLLGLAASKARSRGLLNLETRKGDLLDLGLPPESFDAVVNVFGIFFVADMPAGVRSLWRLVRPGGRLAVTTWGPDLFEPLNTAFWDAVRDERPDLYKGFNPWDEITDPTALRGLLRAGGVDDAEIVAEQGRHPIASAEASWALLLGTGYRGTLDLLSYEARDRVRGRLERFHVEREVTALTTDVMYAFAVKPA
ncbi:MAG TPA: class I SAM-dependent methyltransferase [Candidatus Polarisedimenticolia bacterium]|nr:class I SAM-dependent methyltransferase [Candidatus Polarisedimenticolia bacterium]